VRPSNEQSETCARFQAEPAPPAAGTKVGLALGTRDAGWPITAIRHLPVGDTSGWYVWRLVRRGAPRRVSPSISAVSAVA
jgi:hypothetical protein